MSRNTGMGVRAARMTFNVNLSSHACEVVLKKQRRYCQSLMRGFINLVFGESIIYLVVEKS